MTGNYIKVLNAYGNTLITYEGETKTTLEWAQKRGICLSTFRNWLKKGKSMKDIMIKHDESFGNKLKRLYGQSCPKKISYKEFKQIDVLKNLEKWYSQPIIQGGIENA
ncbi:hypothetical protein AGMMS50268_17080 [Spirochaetia bacterium]|nr:hypothetical protein AGMMS50268_17080 [Spirochaetia bacterium]